MSSSLPIDEHLDEAARLLAPPGATLIVEAPPGAGKTTRLPAHLLAQPWCEGTVLVTEPRRIAARLAAHRVAEERGCPVGEDVGYRVRFEDKTKASTRLIYATEGLVMRQLLEEGRLEKVSTLILDEVHERSADLDVLLALLRKLRKSQTALRLVLMSATLETEVFQAAFPEARLVQSPGRTFDVSISYDPKEDERPLPIRVRSAVRDACQEEGNILVFLPGGGEIRACEDALTTFNELEVLPLHGDLPLDQQAQVMKQGRRKRVILSTNVAESSVTIPGVTTVIDSGLARTGVYDRWSGVKRLETIEISQARCIQRAGRAGRVAPGRAIRLFTKGRFQARPAQDQPPLLRDDLSSVLLMLLAAKHQPDSLQWLSPPEPSAWTSARDLLELLGAGREELTATGREMARLPLPPRLSRVVVEGQRLGVGRLACRAAALLSERDIVTRGRRFRQIDQDVTTSDSDLEDRLELLDQLQDARFDHRLARDLEVDARGAKAVCQLARSLERELGRQDPPVVPQEGALPRALLTGFLDRVAERRGEGRRLVLSTGTQATLHETSAVVAAPLLMALAADAPGGKNRSAQVRIACRLEPDFLLDAAPDAIEAREELVFHSGREKVEQISRISYGKVTLDESRSWAQPSPEAARVLVKAALSKGPAVYDPEGRLESLFVRLALLEKYLPHIVQELAEDEKEKWQELISPPSGASGRAEAALMQAAQTRTSLGELAQAHLEQEFVASLPAPIGQALTRDLPPSVRLQGGRVLTIHYEEGRDPWVESRLQDFFSMSKTPTLCQGRLPISLHLLAPNKRAVQVTTDLDGFWERHYPELRRSLMRRYPKHLWPEDGRTARPPEPGRIR